MNRNIVITGGSGGIGQACARTFLENGDRVFLGWYQHEAPVLSLMKEYPGMVFAAKADLSDLDQIHAFSSEIQRIFHRVDVLVNNAGIASNVLFEDMTDDAWCKMWNLHVTGTVILTRDLIHSMCEGRSGSVINISSMWGLVGGSCEVAYSTAKAAVIGFTKALSREVGPMQVRVNAVAPGVVQTDMMKGYTPEILEELADTTSLCRLGTPQDVANTVFFLASDQASFITGTVLSVDGGFI